MVTPDDIVTKPRQIEPEPVAPVIKVAEQPRRGSGWSDEVGAEQDGAGQDPQKSMSLEYEPSSQPLQDAEIVRGLHWLANNEDGQLPTHPPTPSATHTPTPNKWAK